MSQLLFGKNIQEPKDTGNSDTPEPAFNIVKLNNNLYTNVSNNHRSADEWMEIIPGGAFFTGIDHILGQIIVMVYEDPSSKKISTVLFSSLGEMCYNSLTLDQNSRFFAACENLKDELKKSNVRRALAITLLKTYGSLPGNIFPSNTKDSSTTYWDETVAGELASNMKLINDQTPSQIGQKLMDLGFLTPHFVESTVLDVIYDDDPDIIEANNELVYLLGEQVEHLFDPLTEYSPENKITYYEPPAMNQNTDDGLTKSICSELVQFQENTTHVLIEFLQEFVIPMRIKALNGDINGLDIAKLNQIFPPTIDEVTRINCVLLEALQKATPFGSFEIVKACGTTIPYFYKAYMRHESAMKSFSHLLKGFRREYSIELQPQFSERRIESIMNVSLNLTKIKMILERLINIKNWDSNGEDGQVKTYYQNSVETIDAFAKDELQPYSKRVFTPSGKVLTEICDGIPPLLTYGWLNRKVVSVFDAFNLVSNEDDLIIIFNDYVVFAKIDKDEVTKQTSDSITPHVSDILMNSLMNERPLKNIPNLKIIGWSSIGNFEVETFGNNNIKIILNDSPQNPLVYKVENNTKFVNLLNRARILNKSTPFHLFKNIEFGFTIYSAAHERKIFSREISTSSVALFLNANVDEVVLEDYKLFAALSARFVDEDLIKVEGITRTGERTHYTINSSEFSSFISEKLSSLELQRHGFENNSYFEKSLVSNSALLQSTLHNGVMKQRMSPIVPQKRSSSISYSKVPSRNPSISSCNKPLPKIVDNVRDTKKNNHIKSLKEESESKPKNKLKHRLSHIFSTKKVKPKESLPLDNTMREKIVVTPTQQFSSRSDDLSSLENESEVEEVDSMEDCVTFESSMTPVFDDDDELDHHSNVKSLIETDASGNWLIARDNSSRNFGLQINRTMVTAPEQSVSEEHEPPTRKEPDSKSDDRDLNEKELFSTPIMSRKLPTFNSLDDEFKTPILRVGYNSTEDLNAEEKDEDIFYTPKSFGNDFPEFGSMESLVSKKINEMNNAEDHHISKTQNELRQNAVSKVPESEAKDFIEIHSSPTFQSFHEDVSTDNFEINSLDWKSPSQLNLSRIYEDNLANDESFGYLAGILDNSCIITEGLNNSETYKTLPRSYSSIKYLAAYIDSGTPISKDLLDFLEE